MPTLRKRSFPTLSCNVLKLSAVDNRTLGKPHASELIRKACQDLRQLKQREGERQREGKSTGKGSSVASAARARLENLSLTDGKYDRELSRNIIDPNLLSLGVIFEEGLIRKKERENPGRFVVPGELEYNGILLTPDLLDMRPPKVWNCARAVWEIKATFYSSSKDVESSDFWRFWEQILWYCIAIGTNVGVLAIAHIRGDYSDECPTAYREWVRRFTTYEIAVGRSRMERLRDEWNKTKVEQLRDEWKTKAL